MPTSLYDIFCCLCCCIPLESEDIYKREYNQAKMSLYAKVKMRTSHTSEWIGKKLRISKYAGGEKAIAPSEPYPIPLRLAQDDVVLPSLRLSSLSMRTLPYLTGEDIRSIVIEKPNAVSISFERTITDECVQTENSGSDKVGVSS